MHHQVQLFVHKIEITRDPAVQISYDNKKQIFFKSVDIKILKHC